MEKIFNFLIFSFCAFMVIDSANHLGKLIGFPDMTYIGISILLGGAMMRIIELENKNKKES